MFLSSIKVKVPAKINLFLEVGDKRSDGYHNLETIYQSISLFDEIEITKNNLSKTTVDFSEKTQFRIDLNQSDNIAYKAFELLAIKEKIDEKVDIKITKNIPIAAGMAGGSADAAAVLVATNELFGLQKSKEELRQIAEELGSDVPFCISGGTALGTNKGERITQILKVRELHWAIAILNNQLSTKEVFENFKETKNRNKNAKEQIISWLSDKNQSINEAHFYNNLEPTAISLLPDIRKLKKISEEVGAKQFLLSGSGPTCLFLAKSEKHALEISAELMSSGLVKTVKKAISPAGGVEVIEK